MRKPDFCICENKGADQLCGNRKTDQRLCFRYTDTWGYDSVIPRMKTLVCSGIDSVCVFSTFALELEDK